MRRGCGLLEFMDKRERSHQAPSASKKDCKKTSSTPLRAEDAASENDTKSPLTAFVTSAFLEGNGSSNHAVGNGTAAAGNTEKNARVAETSVLLRCLRAKHGMKIVDYDVTVGDPGLAPFEVDFVVGESSGVCLLDVESLGSMTRVRALTKALMSASIRFDDLWLVIDLGKQPSAADDGKASSKPGPGARARDHRVEGPQIRARASRELVVGGLPGVVLAACLAQLSRSVWHFPCPVHIRYVWGTEETAAQVRVATETAAQKATSLDQGPDSLAGREASLEDLWSSSDRGSDDLAFLSGLPPLNVFSASVVLASCGDGGMDALLTLPNREALHSLVPVGVSRQRLDDLFDLLHLVPPQTTEGLSWPDEIEALVAAPFHFGDAPERMPAHDEGNHHGPRMSGHMHPGAQVAYDQEFRGGTEQRFQEAEVQGHRGFLGAPTFGGGQQQAYYQQTPSSRIEHSTFEEPSSVEQPNYHGQPPPSQHGYCGKDQAVSSSSYDYSEQVVESPCYDSQHQEQLSWSQQRGRNEKLGFRSDPSKQGGQTILHWSPRHK